MLYKITNTHFLYRKTSRFRFAFFPSPSQPLSDAIGVNYLAEVENIIKAFAAFYHRSTVALSQLSIAPSIAYSYTSSEFLKIGFLHTPKSTSITLKSNNNQQLAKALSFNRSSDRLLLLVWHWGQDAIACDDCSSLKTDSSLLSFQQ